MGWPRSQVKSSNGQSGKGREPRRHLRQGSWESLVPRKKLTLGKVSALNVTAVRDQRASATDRARFMRLEQGHVRWRFTGSATYLHRGRGQRQLLGRRA